jgi:hypothetical protein
MAIVIRIQHREAVRRQLLQQPAFSAAIARTDSKNSMCTGPMRVTTAMSGIKMSRSGAMSPGWLMPASNTPKAQSRVHGGHAQRQADFVVELPAVRAVLPHAWPTGPPPIPWSSSCPRCR